MWKRRVVIAISFPVLLLAPVVSPFTIAAIALADEALKPPPKPIVCPESNAHVWNESQCPRLDPLNPISTPGGGAGCNGVLCRVLGGIGGLLGGLSGGLLGMGESETNELGIGEL